MTADNRYVHNRIELLWPDKGRRPVQESSGEWRMAEPSTSRTAVPLTVRGGIAPRKAESIVVAGDRLDALATLRKTLRQGAKLVYFDVPRIEGYDESRAFLGESGKRLGSWLTVVQEHLRTARGVLSHDGIIVCQAGDNEEHFVKMLMQEIFGLANYIGSIVWQSHYSPKGGKPTQEISAIHETLICVARDITSVGPISLAVDAQGFTNADGDPRREWTAKQKDAGRDTARVTYNVPPYRWRLVEGELPPGLWRVSPLSGVIWGAPTAPGRFDFTVEASDSAGQTAAARLSIHVTEATAALAPAKEVWWMTSPPPPEAKMGEIVLAPGSIPLGQETSLVLRTSGGKPFQGNPRPSRGWGFGQATLERAVLTDSCHFAKSGMGIPQPKTYLASIADGVKRTNVSTWWNGSEVGWTQNATKHLNLLQERGIINAVVETAKPEHLLERVVEIFTRQRDLVVELFGRAGDMSVVALKKGRRFVLLAGRSDAEIATLKGCAIPRLDAVIDGREHHIVMEQKDAEKNSISYQGGGEYLFFEVGRPVAERKIGEESARLIPDSYSDFDELCASVLTSEGFIPWPSESRRTAVSMDGWTHATILPPDEFLDDAIAAMLRASLPETVKQGIVYYFRAAEDFDGSQQDDRMLFRRIPMDLSL